MSVVVPTLNCERYIAESLESVVNQTFQDFEILVVDSSTDKTKTIVAEYIGRHPGKITILHQPGRGVSAARNLGIQRSRGEFVAFLDADDVWMPEKLMLQTRLLGVHPQAAMMFTDGEKIDETGVLRRSLVRPRSTPGDSGFKKNVVQFRIDDGSVLVGDLYRDLVLENFIPTSSVTIRRVSFEKSGLFDETLLLSEDHDLWLRIAQRGPILYCNAITSKYRVRNEGLSGAPEIRMYRWHKWAGRMFEKHLKECPREHRALIRRRMLAVYQSALSGYLEHDDFKEVRALSASLLAHGNINLGLALYLLASFFPPRVIQLLKKAKSAASRRSA